MTETQAGSSPARCIGSGLPSEVAMHQVTLVDTAESYRCRSDESLLAGMVRLGRRGIPVGCRGGGCGVCKVEVIRGDYVRLKMSAAHVDAADLANHRLLACKVMPASDLEIRVIGKMAGSVCLPPGEPVAEQAAA